MEASSGLGLATIARCADAWADLHARIAHRFARSEARERAGAIWPACSSGSSARTAGNSPRRSARPDPQGVQRLLSAATWDADGVRDDLRDYVVDASRG